MSVASSLATVIDELQPDRRVLIAFDGPDAAGKTTLARKVRDHLSRPALNVSIDGWHNPRGVRLRRGDESPEGYYRDSFDNLALTEQLLEPFRRGAATVAVGNFDYRSNRPARRTEAAAPTAALLFDGVFLLRPELRAFWDLAVYLHVPESVTLARAIARDAEVLGGVDSVQRRYERRYLPGQAMYRAAVAPVDGADVVIDNSDPENPVVLRWGADR